MIERQYPVEILQNLDPMYTCKKSLDAISLDINGILDLKALSYVHEIKIPQSLNIPRGRVILLIKQPVTTNERYKTRFIVQGRKDIEKEMIIHNSRTV